MTFPCEWHTWKAWIVSILAFECQWIWYRFREYLRKCPGDLGKEYTLCKLMTCSITLNATAIIFIVNCSIISCYHCERLTGIYAEYMRSRSATQLVLFPIHPYLCWETKCAKSIWACACSMFVFNEDLDTKRRLVPQTGLLFMRATLENFEGRMGASATPTKKMSTDCQLFMRPTFLTT